MSDEPKEQPDAKTPEPAKATKEDTQARLAKMVEDATAPLNQRIAALSSEHESAAAEVERLRSHNERLLADLKKGGKEGDTDAKPDLEKEIERRAHEMADRMSQEALASREKAKKDLEKKLAAATKDAEDARAKLIENDLTSQLREHLPGLNTHVFDAYRRVVRPYFRLKEENGEPVQDKDGRFQWTGYDPHEQLPIITESAGPASVKEMVEMAKSGTGSKPYNNPDVAELFPPTGGGSGLGGFSPAAARGRSLLAALEAASTTEEYQAAWNKRKEFGR